MLKNNLNLELLADSPEAIPTLARWYFGQWGHEVEGNSVEKEAEKLRGFLHRDRVPLIVVAKVDGEVVGAAQLKFREMDIFPDREIWLGAVYVLPSMRGKDVAEQMISRLVEIATRLGVQEIFLQTERLDGGLYARLGWRPLEVVTYHGVEVRVMRRLLTGEVG